MRRTPPLSWALVLLVVLAVVQTGCATLDALAKVPQRTQDAVSDPVRRVRLATQIGMSGSAMAISILAGSLLAGPPGLIVGAAAGVLWYFALYEFVLEPISKDRVREGKPSLVGPYWERGPHADMGEVFVNP